MSSAPTNEELARQIEDLQDALLAQQNVIDKLVGQNTAFRMALCALIAAHPDKAALAKIATRMQEVSAAKSLYVAAQDSVLDEAQRVIDELFQSIDLAQQASDLPREYRRKP